MIASQFLDEKVFKKSRPYEELAAQRSLFS
jgi:hypothetical protein